MVNKRARRLDRTYAALADPTRRAIVARLAQGEATVGEVARPFRVSPPAISKHLRVLERAGLLARRREGRRHRLRLRPGALRDAGAWIESMERFWEDRLADLARHLEGASGSEGDTAGPASRGSRGKPPPRRSS